MVAGRPPLCQRQRLERLRAPQSPSATWKSEEPRRSLRRDPAPSGEPQATVRPTLTLVGPIPTVHSVPVVQAPGIFRLVPADLRSIERIRGWNSKSSLALVPGLGDYPVRRLPG